MILAITAGLHPNQD